MTDTLIIAVVTAIATSILHYFVQKLLTKSQNEKDLQKERLTKLLLPLYIQLKKEQVMFEAEIVSENGDPSGFIDDLPRYYESLEAILQNYLYLADKELTEKALSFIRWVNIARHDPTRFEKIVENGAKDLSDEALEEFKECVFRKYEREKKRFSK